MTLLLPLAENWRLIAASEHCLSGTDGAQVAFLARALHSISHHPYNVMNSLGICLYRDEMDKGKLNRYPVFITTQISNGLGNREAVM